MQVSCRLYTKPPSLGKHVRHFSPIIGKFLGSTNSPDGGGYMGTNIKPTAFIANRIQLAGPVPAALRHRYVGFAPFVKAMFRRSGLRGIILHHALHKQHLTIYKWDKNVVWGVIGDNDAQVKDDNMPRPDSVAMARQFLGMTSHGTHGRIFTYVIMLDGEMRFTVSFAKVVCHAPVSSGYYSQETGGQVAIEFLSKHTMHSDVAIEIAYSGEFFVRPLHHRGKVSETEGIHLTSGVSEPHMNTPEHHLPYDQTSPDEFDEDNPPEDPALYELVIDNDSGTYRPRADLLPTLHSYLTSPRNFGALGKVTTIQAFDERLKRWKDARKKAKKGERIAQASSCSSSDSSGVGGEIGISGAEGAIDVEDVRKVLEEDAERARENQDEDPEAKVEKNEGATEGPSRPLEQ